MVLYKSRPYYISPTYCTKPSGPYVSSEELRAFRLFIQEMAPVLTRYSGSDVWLQAVPQAAWKYAAVRHALVACSLVNEAMNYQAGGAKYGRNDAALIHMNKAIRLLTLEDAPTEVMLTIGLILQLLETLNHNARLAMLHLKSAVSILIEYKQQLADGRINNKAQADFILRYLDPTLTLAMKFAEQTIAKSIDADKIDQHSREAFEIRAQATQPDFADTFADDEDASNHLVATASKLMNLRAKYVRLNTKSPKEDPGGYSNDDYHKHSPVPSAAELLDVSSELEYFMRWYTPIYDNNSAGCRLLLAHAETLQMILQDTSHPPHEDRRPYDNEQGERLLEELFEIDEQEYSRSEGTCHRELGLIPPLFYLASHSERCSSVSRRHTIKCLKRNAHRVSKGKWNTQTAAFVAEQIVDLDEELGYGVSTSNHQFQYLKSTDKGVKASRKHVENVELWLSYTITHAMRPISSNSEEKIYAALNPAEAYVRQCSKPTRPCLNELPENIKDLISSYGYEADQFDDTVDSPPIPTNSVPLG